MVEVGHRPLHAVLLEPVVADPVPVRRQVCELVPDRLRVGVLGPVRAECLRHENDDVAVDLGLAGSGAPARTRLTRRSVFVNVPSFSAKLDAGRTTSAYFRVESFRKMSWDIMKSSPLSPSSTWCAFGSVWAGFSPTR
jgi:hypothetical protein